MKNISSIFGVLKLFMSDPIIRKIKPRIKSEIIHVPKLNSSEYIWMYITHCWIVRYKHDKSTFLGMICVTPTHTQKKEMDKR